MGQVDRDQHQDRRDRQTIEVMYALLPSVAFVAIVGMMLVGIAVTVHPSGALWTGAATTVITLAAAAALVRTAKLLLQARKMGL